MKKSNSPEYEFIYTYESEGRTLKGGLFYNPFEYGLTLEKKLNCCLHFRKGDKQVRIKTATGIVIIRQDDKNRPLNTGGVDCPRSKESFEKLLHRCKLI